MKTENVEKVLVLIEFVRGGGWGDGVGPTECAKLVEGFRIRQN